jgi:ABC-2 type transport system ATP-binding protein
VAQTIVDVRDLRKVYRTWTWGRRREVHALRGVSLQACAGEVFGLLGPNGAGKTTLIKSLLGVIRPSGGAASLFGLPAGSVQARQRVGYLPESLRVDRHHTARSALRYYGRMSRMDIGDINRRSDELLELVGLRGRDKESVRRFSKGMYQRLGLAQALMHDPSLLVLDEPTDGLDPVGRNEVRKVIERLSESGKTIFLNSHILQEVELVCTRVAIMSRGEIKAIGKINELAQQEVANPVLLRFKAPSDLSREAIIAMIKTDHTGEASELLGLDHRPSDNVWTLKVSCSEQVHLDELIDRLRQASVSILHLESKQASLEETFIRLVNEPVDESEPIDESEPVADSEFAKENELARGII